MRSPKYLCLSDPEWLEANAARRSCELAREVGCVPSLIAIAYRRAGVSRPGRRLSDGLYPELADRSVLEGRTLHEIMSATGAAEDTGRRALKRAGVTALRRRRPTRWPQLNDADWMFERRSWALGLIADELGCSPTRVAEAFKSLNISRDNP